MRSVSHLPLLDEGKAVLCNGYLAALMRTSDDARRRSLDMRQRADATSDDTSAVRLFDRRRPRTPGHAFSPTRTRSSGKNTSSLGLAPAFPLHDAAARTTCCPQRDLFYCSSHIFNSPSYLPLVHLRIAAGRRSRWRADETFTRQTIVVGHNYGLAR